MHGTRSCTRCTLPAVCLVLLCQSLGPSLVQILAPHEETSVLTQLANLPDDSEIDGAAGQLHNNLA